jgi:lipoate-protein ligase A
MPPRIRLLPFASASGTANMASDESMLISAANDGIASLRFYAWSEPTLSLGYFQPSADREVGEWSGLAWVRRSTGGGGIVHHRELTYSFALPACGEWKSHEPWICRVHSLLREVLQEHGVQSRLVACGEEEKRGEAMCFLHHTAGDLAMGDAKVAGSAQRKMRGALLQHGSLLLRHSEYSPHLLGMCDLANRELFSAQELAELLAAKFAANTGATIEPCDWNDGEKERIPAIAIAKYGNS